MDQQESAPGKKKDPTFIFQQQCPAHLPEEVWT